MSILSLKFFIFLCAAVLFYFCMPSKHQWKALLAISYCFYVIVGFQALFFLVFTSISTYIAGMMIGKINDEYADTVLKYSNSGMKLTRANKQRIKADEDRRKRVVMVTALLLNFGILFVLKYSDVLAAFMRSISEMLNIPYEPIAFSWVVPLGISYYTFQSMGYVIDLYRRKYEPEKNVFRLMLFVSFFPQLIQGPISRYDELAKQLYMPHRFDYKRLRYGVELMAWGIFKKLVISDRIAIMTSMIFAAPEAYGGFYLIFATIFSMFQLYTDFSGGIDIVRGIGEIFGIVMAENFTRPFFAVNLGEYWRRWHITLNNWWRDYIFYPLTLSKAFNKFGKAAKKAVGENFGKKLPILLSVIIIRVINSIWHGATGSSILGGIYYGLLLALSFYFEPWFNRLNERLKINTECISWKIYQCVRTFCLIAAPRLVSQAASLADGKRYFKCLFAIYNPWILFDGSLFELGVSRAQFTVLMLAMLLLLIVGLLQEKGIMAREVLDRQNMVFRTLFGVLFVYAILLFGAYGSGYNASAFAYAQF